MGRTTGFASMGPSMSIDGVSEIDEETIASAKALQWGRR